MIPLPPNQPPARIVAVDVEDDSSDSDSEEERAAAVSGPPVSLADKSKMASFLRHNAGLKLKDAQELAGITKRQDEYQRNLLLLKNSRIEATAGEEGERGDRLLNAGNNENSFYTYAEQIIKKIAGEEAQEKEFMCTILAEEVKEKRLKNEQQAELIHRLGKENVILNCNVSKKMDLNQELRSKNKGLKQQVRRDKARIEKLKTAASDYTRKQVGIDVTSLSEKQKFQALCKLAFEMIDKDKVSSGTNKTAEELHEEKETLKAVFEATYQNMGRRNLSGDKRGITGKINPRILALGLSIASSMSQTAYEKLLVTSPHLPSWSTLAKYKKTVRYV